MDRKKGLLGIKQPKLSPGQQREEQNGQKSNQSLYVRRMVGGGVFGLVLVVVNDKDLGN